MASNPCAKCSKSVFFVEQTIGPKGLFYHKTCLTCATCNKRLETSNLTEHKDQTYCKSCYAKNFGPSGYGFGGGGAGLSVANGASQEAPSISPTAQTNSTPSKWGGATDQCMVCQKNVYFAEKVVGPSNKVFHKLCFKCTNCAKFCEPTNWCEGKVAEGELGTGLYCRPCHSKLFGPKGFGNTSAQHTQ